MEIGKLSSVLQEFRSVFFERLWGGMPDGLQSMENLHPFSFRIIVEQRDKIDS